MLSKILIVAGLVLVALVVVIARRPGSFRYTRSLTIAFDKMCGDQFTNGLHNLKRLAEAPRANSAPHS